MVGTSRPTPERHATNRDTRWSECPPSLNYNLQARRHGRGPSLRLNIDFLAHASGRLQIIRRSLGSSACRPLVEGSPADEVRGYGQVAAGVGKNLEEWLGLPLPPPGRSSVLCKCGVQRQMAGTQNAPAISQLPVQSDQYLRAAFAAFQRNNRERDRGKPLQRSSSDRQVP